MSGIDAANLQGLAKFYDAQREWLTMRWNTLVALPPVSAPQSLPEKGSVQLPLPGFPPKENVAAS